MIVARTRRRVGIPIRSLDVDSLTLRNEMPDACDRTVALLSQLRHGGATRNRRREQQFIVFTASQGETPLLLTHKRAIGRGQWQGGGVNNSAGFTRCT